MTMTTPPSDTNPSEGNTPPEPTPEAPETPTEATEAEPTEDKGLKAEAKKLRQERNRWRDVAERADRRTVARIAEKHGVRDLAHVWPLLGGEDLTPWRTEGGDLDEDRLDARIAEAVQAYRPAQRDQDQGKGWTDGRTTTTQRIGEFMRNPRE